MLKSNINYFYVFCNDLDVKSIDPNKNCICFFAVELDRFLSIIMISELQYKYCHVFKTIKPLVFETDMVDGNIDVPVLLDDVFKFSNHITTYSSFDSDISQ